MATSEKQVKLDDFADGISKFAFNFYRECALSNSGNVVISPLSLTCTLTLFSQGTKGKTYKEIQTALGLNADKTIAANHFLGYYNLLQKSLGGSILSIANHVYIKKGLQLNDSFKAVAVEKFLSGIDSLDFGDSTNSARIINEFIEEKTHQMIKNFIKPQMLTPNTSLILLNAIYFKGNWEYKFDKYLTEQGDFYVNDTQTNTVEFMKMEKCMQYGVLKDLDAAALEMKYANSKFSFLIILPNSRTGITNLEANMENLKLTDITNQMKLTTCDLLIPKFKVEFEINLNNILKKLGMVEMFDNADLSDLVESGGGLSVSEVIQKAIIEVDEEGSKAVAISDMRFCCSGRRVKILTLFHANHAFLFHIVDRESNTIIFSGRAENLKM